MHLWKLTPILVLLVACSGQAPQNATTGPTTPAPTPSATPDAMASETATTSPTPTTEEPTPTPFGAAVFDEPDDCEHSSGVYRLAFPDEWWTNTEYEHADLGTISACRFFAREAFDIDTASREQPSPDGVSIVVDFLEGGCLGYLNPVLEERELTVDGYDARAEELAEGTERTGPGHTYQVTINLRPDEPCESDRAAFIYLGTSRDRAGDYEENKAVLDRMVETMEITDG